VAERCTKIIHYLSRAEKLSWGLKIEAIAVMYKGAILSLLTYCATVWNVAMKYEHNRQWYFRVQRFINLKMARAYRTTSAEALCILTGMFPFTLKLEEAVTRYTFRDTQQQQTRNLDQDVEYRNCPQPAKTIAIVETKATRRQQLGFTQTEASIKKTWGHG